MPKKTAQSKKDGNWRNLQTRIKVKKQTKLALVVLGSIIMLLLFSQLVNLTKTIFSPWQTSVGKDYSWDSHFNLYLALRAKEISLLAYNALEKEITIIKLPDQLYLEVPQDLGRWPVRSIAPLAGDQALKNSLTSFFGLPLDGVISLTGALVDQDSRQFVELIRGNLLNTFQALPAVKSDLTLWELMLFWFNLSSVRFDKIEYLNLVDLNVLDEQRLPDGTPIFTTENVRLDSILQDLVDQTLREEHQTIAVFNTTDYPQLAQKAARMITNLGGNVIIITNASNKQDQSWVVGKSSKTLERLGQIFGTICHEAIKCDKLQSLSEDLASSRAEINIILGEDFYLKFGNK